MHLLPYNDLVEKHKIVPRPFTTRSKEVKGINARSLENKSKINFVIPKGEVVEIDNTPLPAHHWSVNSVKSKPKRIKFIDKNGKAHSDILIATNPNYCEILPGNKLKIITEEDKGLPPEAYSYNVKEIILIQL